jgi:hypothetical protein
VAAVVYRAITIDTASRTGRRFNRVTSGPLRTSRLVPLRIIDHPLDLKARIAEIEEQAEPEPGSFEVVDALRAVNRIQRGDRFQFNQNGVLHQQVGRIRTNDDTIMVNCDIVLLLDRQAGFPQFKSQGVFIDLFALLSGVFRTNRSEVSDP